MKELSIEQKAQAYDKAIHRAKITLDCCDSTSTVTKNTVYGIFPELRESEDEKIRKALINIFATHKDYEVYFGVSVEDIRVWLESQVEQKSIETTWKPSDEQLYFLNWLANNVLTDGEVDKKASEILNELYEDLKKL